MNVSIEDDPNFKKILTYLHGAKGFHGHQYKVNYVKRRVAVRMRAVGAGSYSEYLSVLEKDKREPALLMDRLTIHVTEFFRDPGVYKAIQEKVFPDFSNKQLKKIKVWCAGCSTGEEPYSIAMILADWMATRPGLSFEIFATDIDGPSIRTAENGEYAREAIRKIPKDYVARWFYSDGTKVRVSQELKHHIRFRTHDLLGSWVRELSDFHLLFCRNLLIYLTGPQQQSLYEQFAHVLIPGGYLILGLTETLLGTSRKFYRCADVKNRIYQTLDNSEQLDSEREVNG